MADLVRILLSGIGKKYKRSIFKNVNLDLDSTQRHAIVGRNGSGKSTLLKIMSGYTSPTIGDIRYFAAEQEIAGQDAVGMMSFSAPYIDLIEELSVAEIYRFHTGFKRMYPEVHELGAFLDQVQLRNHGDVIIGDLSSGLMQRLKVGLTILSKTPILLLDEPTSYLDSDGKNWFKTLLDTFGGDRLVVIASNDPEDVLSCNNTIDIQSFYG